MAHDALDMEEWTSRLIGTDPQFVRELRYVNERHRSESPLEKVLLIALIWRFRKCHFVSLEGRPLPRNEHGRVWSNFATVDIAQQVVVGTDRVDFMLTIRQDAIGKAFLVAVECDGHAYHSDPSAVSRDHARDRRLLRQGVQTLRFTYSDIVTRTGEVTEEIFKTFTAISGLLPDLEAA